MLEVDTIMVWFFMFDIFRYTYIQKLARAQKEKFIHLSEREIPVEGTEVASAPAAVSAAHCVG